jgi:diguanylate cyclase (GGDEF)-like protein/PAS domain S-box-containing protein
MPPPNAGLPAAAQDNRPSPASIRGLWSQRINIGYLLSLLILVAAVLLVFRSLSGLVAETEARARGDRTLEALNAVLSHLKDADTAERGYLLTGRERYLEPYLQATMHIPPLLDEIARSADELAQPALAPRFVALSREKLSDVEASIETLRDNGQRAALARFSGNQGKRIMDQVRHAYAGLEAAQRDLLLRRDAEIRASTTRTIALAGGGVLLVLLMSGSGIVVSARESARRRRAEARLQRFHGAMEAIDDMIFLVDRQTLRLLDFNQAVVRRLGYTRDELAAMTPYHFFRDAKPGEIEAQYDQVIAAMPRSLVFSGRQHRRDGVEFPVETQRRAIIVDGRPIIVGVVRDITERQRNERALQESRDRMEHSLQAVQRANREISVLSRLSSVLQACTTVEETFKPVSTYCAQLFPDCAGAMYLLNNSQTLVEEVCAWGNRASPEPLMAPDDCWALRRGGPYRVTRPAGEVTCPHVARIDGVGPPYLCIPMIAHNETIGLFYLEAGDPNAAAESLHEPLAVSVVEQVSMAIANLKLRELLRKQSTRDPLTGLYNRRFMEDALAREIARAQRKGGPLSVIAIDVDHFKRFNDTFGHDAGDLVLKELARFLSVSVRNIDLVCRPGGEEFIVILPDAALENAVARGQQMVACARTLTVRHLERALGPITLSIGVAECPNHGVEPEALLQAADSALYRAKRNGRDRVEVAAAGERLTAAHPGPSGPG